MKTPKFLSKLSAVLTPKSKKLRASARAANPAMMSGYDEEPMTKLSSAFFVVLILHVVAVGGIYAFNSIKASRRGHEVPSVPAPAPANPKPAAKTEVAPKPPASTALTETFAPTPTGNAPARPGAQRQYEVKAGDNLTKIAFAFGVTAADIAAANNIKETAVLRPDDKLIIPARTTAKVPPVEAKKPEPAAKATDVAPTKTTPGLYIVKKDDTATSIARRFGITAAELLKLNKISDPKKLQLGQALKVPPRKS